MPSPLHSDLESGLAAIKQKQYVQAIALLEPLAKAYANRSVGIRAQMGLVVAYEQTANPSKAIALCHQLSQQSQETVKLWGSRHLQRLRKRYPETDSATIPVTETGFTPFNPIAQSTSVQPTTPLPSPQFPPTPPQPQILTEPEKPQKPVVSNLPNLSKDPVETPPKPISQLQQESLNWRNAPRAQQWPRLKQPQFWRFRLEQIVTVIAFLWFTPRLVEFLMDTANDILRELPFVRPLQLFYRDPTQWVYITLALLFIFSPWILDKLLKMCIGLRSLPMTTLFQRSPETNRILRSYCQQRNWSVPKLRLLPISVPLVMSYGCLPRFSRIVVSQGLLEQLTEDEIAVILVREVAQMGHGDHFVMSFVTMILQIPYLIYWQLSHCTEQLADVSRLSLPQWFPHGVKSGLKTVYPILQAITFVLAPFSYGLFWLLRGLGVWLSRRRVDYSDRAACNLTGNPNALTRALVKIAIGLAQDIQQQGKTRFLLEGFELLMPVGYRQALTFGSIAPHYPMSSLLQWDVTNPYHSWLALNNSHPVIGDRLGLLGRYSQFWKLDPEFDFMTVTASPQSIEYPKLLRQGAPFFGLVAGILIGSFIWLLGGIFAALGIWQLEWLWGDTAILTGCIPIGCSLGMFMRINSFFPDLKPTQCLTQPDLAELHANPQNIPVDSIPIVIKGQLLGRSILSNRMGQDLILSTPTGLIQLHYVPALTPLGNFLPQFPHPADFIHQSVQVMGWWRRGATPWIDVDRIQTLDQSVQIQGGHPIWSTFIAALLAVWGTSFIFQGGF